MPGGRNFFAHLAWMLLCNNTSRSLLSRGAHLPAQPTLSPVLTLGCRLAAATGEQRAQGYHQQCGTAVRYDGRNMAAPGMGSHGAMLGAGATRIWWQQQRQQ